MTLIEEKPYDELLRTFSFKHEEDVLDLLYIPLTLQFMFLDIVSYCRDTGLPKPVITRIIDKKIPGVSTTNIHASGRAMDLRSSIYSSQQIIGIVDYITNNHLGNGALSISDGKPRPIIYENGKGGPHLHLQVRP